MTEMVEVQRLELTEEQALTVKTLSKSVNDHQARYGQIALAVDSLRAQLEQNLQQYQKEGEAVKAALTEATQGLQSFSTRLAEEFQLDLSDGVWTLNVDDGHFVQTKRPEDISTGRGKHPPKRKVPSRRTATKKKAVKKAAKRTSSARK